jgi:hypothetical protein
VIPIHALVLSLSAAPPLASASPLARAVEDKPQRRWSIFAEQIHTSAGRTVASGMVFVNNGTISLVSPGREDAPESEIIRVHSVTPGLVDASARVDVQAQSVEHSSEISPAVRVADSLGPFSIEWDRQVRSGVTTVLCNPPDYGVVGGLGIVLKTAGPESIAARTVRADAVLRGAMGSQPSQGNHPAFGRPNDFFSRRPTTRMGVEWEWRNAFFDAAASRRDPERAYPGSDLMLRALDGDLPIAIQTWTTQDIRTAVFLKEEVERDLGGKPRMFLDAAAEAWKEPDLLARSKVGVVLPPFPAGGRSGEGAFMAWNVAKLLHDRGIPFALSSHGSANHEDRLAQQAGYAMRGGLDFESALAAVTIQPARMLGVQDRVGSIEVGKDADLVLWNGPPFEPSSRIVGVLVDGVLKVDPR